MDVLIVGQGYVGLPLAMRAARAGHRVTGIDLDERRTAALRRGTSFVEDIPDSEVQHALAHLGYRAVSDYADVDRFDVAVITVPTPLTDSLPDLRMVESAARALAPLIVDGALVVLESTTHPGTTEDLLVPILEAGSGKRAGVDFSVGYSPERIDPGNTTWRLENTPKVVSGIDDRSLERVQAFYGGLVERIVPVAGTREAELTKLLENTFRHVNIALVNEMAIHAEALGVDIWQVIEAASTKPFGFMPFTPGPGVGGHCLPVDPSYLSWQVRKQLGKPFRFVELANDVNEHMPDHVVERVSRILNDAGRAVRGARVLLLGLSYKPNTGDVRESPAMRVLELLCERGAAVTAVDPHVEDHRWPSTAARAVDLDAALADEHDVIVLLTGHAEFDRDTVLDAGIPVLDTRNALRSATRAATELVETL